ncbi:Protein kinase domain-containing protein [Heracleum sosnowskyi]|uniref:Protein kinase domain-containing protein n=1 Tax=Heracleum sosnowskyi TaxID=360622 RepID=A0AAD8ML78_9APIA|nr:Protein kinase domain-containing protein [Heracleum sosnowskyi]
MAFLKFKIRQKRVHDGVVAVADGCINGRSNVLDNFVAIRFSWEEIQVLTMNRSSSRMIGYGGFSSVYLANFLDSSLGAVKVQCGSERLNQVYKQELKILLTVSHPNIVKLKGYCDERDEGVLVFDYMCNGTLDENLRGRGKKNSMSLSWKRRMVIAFQLALAIEYLHEKCSLQIVHGDIKASNVLLDENFNCKLCDFGSAKMGFRSMVLPPPSSSSMNHNRLNHNRMIVGSQGYLDPHYLKTGLASKKQDIYSFGVILLELITGTEAFCAKNRKNLTTIADPMIRDPLKVKDMVDSRFDNDHTFSLEEAKVMASVSAKCLGQSPSIRLSASEIVTTMKDQVPSISYIFEKSTTIAKE